ncbi:RNase H domain-containing protein [Trichonephila clavipes]|nr:RNase H domain-containing protein [Trichonephila clavipes]
MPLLEPQGSVEHSLKTTGLGHARSSCRPVKWVAQINILAKVNKPTLEKVLQMPKILETELIAIMCGLSFINNIRYLAFYEIWILTDSRSSIQHLSNWPSIGDSTSRSIPHLFQRLSDRHPIHLQWVPSHIGLLGDEVADDLAKAAISNPVDPEDHMVLTLTEIYSRAKELICRTWVVPPVHPRYFQRHPGSTISFKSSRSYETAFSRFSTGHLRCMNFEGGKRSFPICPKCNISQSFFSSAHSAMSGVFL